jgi:hypothetical protein
MQKAAGKGRKCFGEESGVQNFRIWDFESDGSNILLLAEHC